MRTQLRFNGSYAMSGIKYLLDTNVVIGLLKQRTVPHTY